MDNQSFDSWFDSYQSGGGHLPADLPPRLVEQILTDYRGGDSQIKGGSLISEFGNPKQANAPGGVMFSISNDPNSTYFGVCMRDQKGQYLGTVTTSREEASKLVENVQQRWKQTTTA